MLIGEEPLAMIIFLVSILKGLLNQCLMNVDLDVEVVLIEMITTYKRGDFIIKFATCVRGRLWRTTAWEPPAFCSTTRNSPGAR